SGKFRGARRTGNGVRAKLHVEELRTFHEVGNQRHVGDANQDAPLKGRNRVQPGKQRVVMRFEESDGRHLEWVAGVVSVDGGSQHIVVADPRADEGGPRGRRRLDLGPTAEDEQRESVGRYGRSSAEGVETGRARYRYVADVGREGRAAERARRRRRAAE